VAWRMKFISESTLRELADSMGKSSYRDYLLELVNTRQ
jgi:hypothetical protein